MGVKSVEAVYENGVFKPKGPVELEEKTEVRLVIETETAPRMDEDDPTGWKTARRFIGIIQNEEEGVAVARDHDKYLYK